VPGDLPSFFFQAGAGEWCAGEENPYLFRGQTKRAFFAPGSSISCGTVLLAGSAAIKGASYDASNK
jgi:hypothetical protein